MADYYPLIARAIAGLDPNAPGESRRALYERARAALIQQLRSVQPPLSESEITRERLSLEEAVRKVESEAAQRAREASRPGGGRGDAFRRANARPPEANSAAGAPPARPRLSNPPPPDPRPPRNPRADAPPAASPRPQTPPAPPPPPADAQVPPTRERPGVPPRRATEGAAPPAAPGVRGFRDITADADDLGRAAAQASRNARKTYANVPSPSPEFDRLEPNMENRGADPDAELPYDEAVEEAERYAPPPQRTRIGNVDREPKKRIRIGSMFPFKSAIVIGILLILAGAGLLWGKPAYTYVSSLFKPSPSVEAPKDASAPAVKPKIADRVGQPSASGEPIAPVAQRVVLYDEDPSDPKGKQYVGSVVWRTEQVKASGNQPPDIAVRADIDIPDRKFKMTMSFRRNTDTSLPASHTAELTFVLPPDFANGGVGNVPGILMKSNEQARGTPLAGLAVKVTDGFFLVGLSNVDADRSRNLQLLKERSWFDVPLVYTNQRRAIIAIEKGAPGERAFNEAFAAWGE
ncbi:hypothetical protein MTX26_05245 [Bradyrhizobium sp. ISRA443]|uniref:hypothetical protein n=1 Tax=unclassified Bradyrhizobium TaxID=2631580 RepID=UPI00247AC0C0|nr:MULTISPECIES: hypothetical protein [unclassified Bradyrhizobium]WGS00259.1 hypothetical protein MTX23_05245 [Bradyrhizobium sp. ISRA436]WGS07148.1 hypothetical protein MTX18_05245 [Bradyrhizobium sp. ISRA437]WGS14033.1 hypothetical protein MTX26_05245 [Bradyrhizobium sp. ISRA443]